MLRIDFLIVVVATTVQAKGESVTETFCAGCKVDGVCHELYSIWTKNCVTYLCSECRRPEPLNVHLQCKSWFNDESRVQYINIGNRECEDSFGVCRPHNKTMSKWVRGIWKSGCLCIIDGLTRTVQCPDN